MTERRPRTGEENQKLSEIELKALDLIACVACYSDAGERTNWKGLEKEFAERLILLEQEAFERGVRAALERAADHFAYPTEKMRLWIQAHYPDASISDPKYTEPRYLMSALIRSIDEIRSIDVSRLEGREDA